MTVSQTKPRPTDKIGVGIVGAGSRGAFNLGTKMLEMHAELSIRLVAVADRHPQRLGDAQNHLAKVAQTSGVPYGIPTFYDDAQALIDDPAVDVVMVTTPQHVHDPIFIAAAKAGKRIYCDKPLAHTLQACDQMLQAQRLYQSPCIVGFTRRYENTWMQAHQIVQEGTIGTPRMLLLRSVIPFHRYFSRWHRRSEWSGGLLNEKGAHLIDMLNWFANSEPVSVFATGGRSVFVPKPNYPARCSECSLECPYRQDAKGDRLLRSHAQKNLPQETVPQDELVGVRMNYDQDPDHQLAGDLCVFGDEANVDDHNVVTITYRNGIQAVFFFSVFGPATQDQETLEVLGDQGKLILNRHAGKISLDPDHGRSHEEIDSRDSLHHTSHFGADHRLMHDLDQFAQGNDNVPATFEDAYRASAMAFLAQQSVHSGQPVSLTEIESTLAGQSSTRYSQ